MSIPLISMANLLPSIPAKRYFTIGEVSELCCVKPYVLRYWEQEFTQLKPMKRRGNRRYYQHHEVLLIRRIRALLYDQGFTISGARNRLSDHVAMQVAAGGTAVESAELGSDEAAVNVIDASPGERHQANGVALLAEHSLRAELLSIRELLTA